MDIKEKTLVEKFLEDLNMEFVQGEDNQLYVHQQFPHTVTDMFTLLKFWGITGKHTDLGWELDGICIRRF